ncbi:MAG TPA: AAA family ATPase, partial [Anaerolineaceae bacterium]
RMQAAARPNTALMTEATYRQVSAVFDCADLGSIPVKGKAEPVHVYELLRPKSHPERQRGLQGSGGHLVGREDELSALLKAGNAVLAGLGRAALITGEPGIGKSRLVAEWKELLAAGTGSASGLRWAEGRCLSYGQGMAYHLLVDLLRSLVGIAPAAGDEDARAALAALCEEQFGSQAGEVFPYLAHLLALPLEGEASERVRLLDPQSLQARYLDSLSRLLRSFSVHGPLGIVLDDIHWADPSSVDLLIRLLPLTAEAPLLFCLITRPERDAPGWKLVEAAREQLGAGLVELELPPLTGTESQALASGLLENADLPGPVCDLILGKAEGNPLFVEEVIRMLIDRGFIRREGPAWALAREVESVDIPDNLQSLLLARIDHLPEEVKRTLRVAAVIGRQFSVRVLREVLRNQEVPA